MRAFAWLRSLLSSERGNVLVIGAATMPLLIGSAAFAVDTIQLSVWKRQLQRAADSSAIAGAYALSQGMDTHNAVHNDLEKNSFPVLTQEEDIDLDPRLGYDRVVRVQLTATRTLPFLSIFTGAASNVVADATAALVTDGTFCMVSLYDGDDAGIVVHGGADVDLGCGMKTNSTAEQAIITNGNGATISATPIAAVGGLDGSSNNFVDGETEDGETRETTLQPHSAKQSDPLAWVPNPTIPSGCTEALTPAVADTLADGGTYCFTSLDVKPSETMNLPSNSTIIINGGDVDIQGDINGAHVAIVMSGTDGDAGGVKINSQAKLNLTAPDSGSYKGILFYRDRRADNAAITINGGAESILQGALYFPTSDITLSGHADMNVACLQMVGQKLNFGGTANITNVCPANSGSSAFEQTIVRLID
ncbi:MAG TPA: pilus assembly protein TadG-related protein [Allosphingosinicella sp.]|jgi:Flp pilus assembly protein TadG